MVRRSTWIVLGIFILLVGFTIFFQRYQVNKPTITPTSAPTTAVVYLYNLENKQLNDIKIVDNTGKSIDLYRDPTTTKWAIADIPVDKVDSSQIESISTQLSSLQVLETMTQTLLPTAVGLDTPAYTITLTTVDGTQMVTHVGMQTAIGEGYYIRNDNGQIVIVDKTTLDDILNALKSPPLLPTATPEVTPTETISPTEPVNHATPTP